MKNFLLVLLLSLFAMAAFAADTPNYVGANLGVYAPQADDMDGFSTGFNGELLLGRHFSRNIAAEVGVSYFLSDGPSGQYIGRLSGVTWTGTFDVSVVPVTLTGLGILPLKKGELFAGFGVGAYFSTIKAVMNAEEYPSQTVEASDTPFGIRLSAGGNYQLAGKLGIRGELHYILAGAEFSKTIQGFSYSRDFGLDGITATAGVFCRF